MRLSPTRKTPLLDQARETVGPEFLTKLNISSLKTFSVPLINPKDMAFLSSLEKARNGSKECGAGFQMLWRSVRAEGF